jgi:hypothetical protein
MTWQNFGEVDRKQYQCGFCGYTVANNKGYFWYGQTDRIILCPNCNKPTYFDHHDRQFPGVAPGNEVLHLPSDLHQLYLEARDCCSVSAFTASVLACRKLLMNIAVQQGAKEGLKFIEYVDFLATNGYIPPNGRGWVDHIRKKGNEATHEIALMAQADAEELIAFSEMLLKFIYEFPSKVPPA